MLPTFAQRNGRGSVSIQGFPVAEVDPDAGGHTPHNNRELLLEELELNELEEDGQLQFVLAKETKSPLSPAIFALFPNKDHPDPVHIESVLITNLLSFASSSESILESTAQEFPFHLYANINPFMSEAIKL